MLLWAASQIFVPFVTLGAESRQARLQWRGVIPLLRRLLRRGIPASLANGLTLVGYRMDLIVVAAFLSVADVGRYSIAMAAGEVLFMLSRSVLTGGYEAMIASDFTESVRVAVRTFRHTLALLVPVGLLMTLVAWPLAGPLLGEDFAESGKLILLLVPGFIAVSVGELMANFFLVRMERSREVLITASAAALANLVLATALVQVLGLEGAAIATSLSYTLAMIYLLIRFRQLGGPPRLRDYLPGRDEADDYRRIAAYLHPRRLRRLVSGDGQG
jgi:O-antigen/teichoic acid export membrane protein